MLRDRHLANPNTVEYDQRYVTRPQHGRCDIGAVERDFTAPTVTGFTLTIIPPPNAAGWNRVTTTVRVSALAVASEDSSR